MKALITLSIILFCWFTTFHSFAQVSAYTFTPVAGTFTEITVSGGATELSLSGGSLDDGWYNNIPTGFNFVFDGTNYTALSAATNGFVLLGANLGSAYYTNNLTSGTPRPILAPLWDDIAVGSSGSFRYVTTGTTGSKVFTAQWLMMYWDYSASTASVSFQVKLYESSNKIEFIYRQEAASSVSPSASIGISGINSGSGNFLSLNGSGSNPTVSSSTETTIISLKPATGQTYRFSPPGPVLPNCADTPNPPSGVTITPSILCWSDGGGNASGFKLYLDTINPPTMLVQDSTIFCYTLSTLSLNKTYYWKVVPYNLAGDASGCTVWNFTTPSPMTFISCTTTQGNTNNLAPNQNDQVIIGIEIATTGILTPLNVTSFTFTTDGSSNPLTDISNAKLYYSGINSSFTTTTQIGSPVFSPNGNFTITGIQTLSEGINYFWLAYDISPTATVGDFLDAQCISVTVGTPQFPIITNPSGARQIANDYCTGAGGTCDEYISNVSIGTINNSSGCSSGGYANYSLITTNIIQGSSLTISITNGSLAYPTDKCGIWVDWNNNGDFTDDQAIIVIGSPGVGPYTATINCPLNATLGSKRMRIRIHYTDEVTSPCGNSVYGEVEDYSINVIDGNPCPGLSGSSIYGTLSYDNDPVNSSLSCSKIYLKTNSGTIIDSTFTDQNGYYYFCQVPPGDYKLSVKTNKACGGINSTDAMLDMKHFTQLINLVGLRYIAGEVNGNNFINSIDALLIAKRFVGYNTTFPVGDWAFDEPQINISLSGAHIINIKGICIGDVNGSYVPPKITTSLAGPDQLNLQDTNTILVANQPAIGETGLWTILSGTGGNLADNSNPQSSFTGLAGQTYQLIWTISNACNNSNTDTLIVSFALPMGQPCPGIPNFTYGGQTYNTVQIGTQCIMKENLNIGTYVPSVYTGSTHSDVSNNGIIEKYCYNNDQANCAIYGGLYDWNEMMQYSTTAGIQGICPSGWHIPTDAEWSTLVSFLGGWSVAGGKMKETGFVHWYSPNTGATNLSGFTAFGAGYRHGWGGNFYDLQSYANFWSSSQYSSPEATNWGLYNGANTTHSHNEKTLGFSIRCFKDTCSPIPTHSDAGPDQTIVDTITTLSANTPTSGTGSWSIISGIGGSIAQPNSPVSGFTGNTGTTYTLLWTIATICYSSIDTIVISFAMQMGQPCPGLSSFIYGGQTYNTVQIGTQCIMKENLNIGTYVTSISTGSAHSDMSNNGIIEKYCYNNDQANCAIYGGLYDWNEMMQYSTTAGIQGICPAGWHIPTDAEWTTLVTYLGGESVAGGKMKETGFVHWSSPNTGATNQSGFTAFGAGYRTNYGGFYGLQNYAYFWSSSQNSSPYAWDRYLAYYGTNVNQFYDLKAIGFSVRCFKDY